MISVMKSTDTDKSPAKPVDSFTLAVIVAGATVMAMLTIAVVAARIALEFGP